MNAYVLGEPSARTTNRKSRHRPRHSFDLSQEALADEAGLHRTYVVSVKRGDRNVSLDNIYKLATALNVQPRERVYRGGPMSKPKLTGVSAWGLSWDYVASNKDLARRVLVYLEDCRVLTDDPNREDYDTTRLSADLIRKFLTLEIMNVQAGGELERALKAIRTASRAFVDAAGMDSKLFKSDHRYFVMSLAAYREVVARQVAAISVNFKIPLTGDLHLLLAEHDLSSHRP